MSKPVEIEVYTLAKYKDKTCNLQELLEYLYNENQKKDNIIKEVREYATRDLRLYDNESVEFEISNKLLEILDNGVCNNEN